MLEQKVVSRELAEKLKEIGYSQNSFFYHFDEAHVYESDDEGGHCDNYCIYPVIGQKEEKESEYLKMVCSAPTTDELLEILPKKINENVLSITRTSDNFISGYMTKSGLLDFKCVGKTASDSLARLLIDLRKRGIYE